MSSVLRGRKKTLDPLVLELQTIVGLQWVQEIGNQTQVLCKRSMCS